MNEKKLIDEVNERLQKACSKFIDEYITKYYKDLVEENERLREDLYDARHMMCTRGEENKKLKEENKKLKEDVDYRHHRCMVAERGGEDED